MNSYVSCGFKAQLAEGSFTLVAGVHVQLQQRGEGSKNNFEASTYIHRGSKNKYLRHPKKQNIPLESLVLPLQDETDEISVVFYGTLEVEPLAQDDLEITHPTGDLGSLWVISGLCWVYLGSLFIGGWF